LAIDLVRRVSQNNVAHFEIGLKRAGVASADY